MPLIPVLRRQKQVDPTVKGQPGLHREFQASQGYTVKPVTTIYPSTPTPHAHARLQKKKMKILNYLFCVRMQLASWERIKPLFALPDFSAVLRSNCSCRLCWLVFACLKYILESVGKRTVSTGLAFGHACERVSCRMMWKDPGHCGEPYPWHLCLG